MSNSKDETEVYREMFSDQLHAHRMAIAWLMMRVGSTEANEWLSMQRTELKCSEKLGEVEIELGLIQEDLQMFVEQSN